MSRQHGKQANTIFIEEKRACDGDKFVYLFAVLFSE